MLDKLKDLFKEGLGYTHTSGILQQIANIVNIVHVQYMKDGDAKNEAIDILCALLQSHKEVPAPEALLQSHKEVPAPEALPESQETANFQQWYQNAPK